MSDEQQQYEQFKGAPPEPPEPPKNAWGDPLGEERQRELLGMQAAWDAPDADHGPCNGPFDGVGLQISGADVSWLTEQPREEVTRRPTHHAGVLHMRSSLG